MVTLVTSEFHGNVTDARFQARSRSWLTRMKFSSRSPQEIEKKNRLIRLLLH